MTDLIPDIPRLTITHSADGPTQQKLQKMDHLVILVPDSMTRAALQRLPGGSALQRVQRQVGSKTAVPAAQTRLANKAATGISLGMLPKKASTFQRLETARKHLAYARTQSNPATLGVLITGFDDTAAAALASALTAAALALVSPLPTAKSKPAARPRLRALQLYGASKPDLRRLRAENAGNHLARWLTVLPPNQLDAASYRKRASALATRHGWDMTFLDQKALKRRGAGAFLAVAQAGDANAGIIRLRYRPSGKKSGRPDLALVGKGVCFDTGGVNLKPARYMQNMHDDMQGSAVALGTLLALTESGSELDVDCWLAVTENLIGPAAYKPMDVVSAVDGTTIEVIHTDAEGRMALADTLAMAAEEKPRVMIDYATLTGACVAALTTRYSGAFANRDAFNAATIAAGAACGERIWPFPMDDDFDRSLDSPIADIRQCTLDGEGDHILAARFLSRFAGKVPWLHLDLASGRHKGGLGHVPSDVTGFGVNVTLSLLLEQDLVTLAG
ncbi:MAG: leucyl aminopeptidase family protein [Gammaproteobacteria bacterium]|nr:leucyl aminopeptidase family protein [Gammaproteobacteria bacterium]NNM20339.1 leucyl aminopeptidase family protein [Gammaproteobacteria bacterium]